MSKKLPNYQEKQHILYTKRLPEKELITYGDSLLEKGKIFDAIDFYQKANHVHGLEKIKSMAELSGDVMLLQQVLKPLKQTITEETWISIGESAIKCKKYLFAFYAFEKGNNDNMVGRVKEIIKSEDNGNHR
jgi:hypothetical protein